MVFSCSKMCEAISRGMQSGVEVLCNQAQQMREQLLDAALGRGKVLFGPETHFQ
jgi:hypothetical protein